MIIKHVRFWLVLAVLNGLGAGIAGAGGLSAGIQDAAALSRAYSFAKQCVDAGKLKASELAQFQTQLLDVLEEKYSLAVDERLVLVDYLVGAMATTMTPQTDLIVPASGRSCDMATQISR